MRKSLLATALFISSSLQAATITVTYDNMDSPAIGAFAKAADIWAGCLASDIEVKVRVSGIERGPTGFALPRGVRNEAHLPMKDTWYPTALANALKGERDSDLDDMNIFMSKKTNWFYGDGEITPEQTDYINVAVHEIAHGLGISSGSFIPWQGEKIGSIGMPNEYINFFQLSFELPELDGTPLVYDRMIMTADNKAITSFANPSKELATALTTDGIYFSGDVTTELNGTAVKVTPGNISHIPAQEGQLTPIMLSNSGIGESIHQPDPILLAMLTDLGWEISQSCR